MTAARLAMLALQAPRALWALGALAAGNAAHAQVSLAGVFGDHMVLQRGVPIRLWGRAEAGEPVTVSLAGRTGRARADARGHWRVALPPRAAGGPFELTVRGAASTQVLRDVLVGDVWIAAGQSNMEWPLAQSGDAAAHLARADLPRIRHAKVTHRARLQPADDLDAPLSWQPSTPASAGEFSAVAWHFARRVQQTTGVPIGLLNLSWGGTHIETWTSRHAALADPDLAPWVRAMPADDAGYAAAARARSAAQVRRWQGDGVAGPGSESPTLDDGDWNALQTPLPWESQGLPGFDGTLWLRRRLELTAEQAAGEAVLHLAMIDDCDDTFVNGMAVASTCGWDTPRRYALPAGSLRPGANLIAVRVRDTGGGGGYHGQPDAMRLDTAAGSLPLHGPWRARVESALDKTAPGINDLPTLGFNGMVAPVTPLPVRGVLWYQGESNVPRAARYAGAMRRLVADWRAHWRAPRMPFLYVQLASFLPPERNSLQASPWAELRDAQRQALDVPGTGMAVTIDVGDALDIHPRDKHSVGERLARIALRQVHGRRDVVAQGPVPRRWRAAPGGAFVVDFDPGDAGLAARGGGDALHGFALAGADGRFHAAQATIVSPHRVRVRSPEVSAPRAVRYAWVDNALDANLTNRRGLPASPFRTDRARWVTRDGRFGD